MSLGVVVKGPEGLVLAADSRVTLMGQIPGTAVQVPTHFDNATKLLTFEKQPWIGAVTYGQAVIGSNANDLRTAHSYLTELNAILPEDRLTVEEFAQRLSDFYIRKWRAAGMPEPFPGQGMEFVVAGFDPAAPYGTVCVSVIPNQPTPELRSVDEFSVTWGGQTEYATRLLNGYDLRFLPILQQTLDLNDTDLQRVREALNPLAFTAPYNILPLQDCINLAVFLIRTTITAQSLSISVRGVGGTIDIATITSVNGVQIIQQKKPVGEIGVI